MTGRRRETRFLPSRPWSAALQTLDDVVLEESGNGEISVLSAAPARQGDKFILEIATGGLRLDVTVLRSEPVLVDGSVRHRLQLRSTEAPGADADEPSSLTGKAGGKNGSEVHNRT